MSNFYPKGQRREACVKVGMKGLYIKFYAKTTEIGDESGVIEVA